MNEVETGNPLPLPPILHLTWNTDGEKGPNVDWAAAMTAAGIDLTKAKNNPATAPLVVVYVQEATTGTVEEGKLKTLVGAWGYEMLTKNSLDGHSGKNSILRKKIKVVVYQLKTTETAAKYKKSSTVMKACNTLAGVVHVTEKGAAGVRICRPGPGSPVNQVQCMQFHTVHMPDKPAAKRLTCLDSVLQAAPKALPDELIFFVGDFNARIWVSPAQIAALSITDPDTGTTDFGKISTATQAGKFPANWPRLQDSNFHGSTDINIGVSLNDQAKTSAAGRTDGATKNDVSFKYRLPTPTYTVIGAAEQAKALTAGKGDLSKAIPWSPDLKGIAGGYKEGYANVIGLKEKKAAITGGNFLDSIAYLDQIAANSNAWTGYSKFRVGVYPGANKGIEDHAFTVWEALPSGGASVCTLCADASGSDNVDTPMDKAMLNFPPPNIAKAIQMQDDDYEEDYEEAHLGGLV